MSGNMSVRTKLMSVVGVPAVALVLAIAASAFIFQALNESARTIYEDRVVPLKQLKAISDDYAVLIIDAVNKANAGIFTPQQALKDVTQARQRIQDNWKSYRATYLTPRETILANEAEILFGPANAQVLKLEQALAAIAQGQGGAMAEFDGPLYQTIDPITSKINELVELQLEVAKAEFGKQTALSKQASFWLIFGGIPIILLVIAFGYLVTRSIIAVIHVLSQTMEDVEKNSRLGLRIGVKSNDEFGKIAASFNKMMEKICSMIGEVSGSAAQLASAAEEMSAVTEQTSQGVRRQQAETDQVATAMNEMSATVQEVARNAVSAATAAQQADSEANIGKKVVAQTMEAIDGLAEEVDKAGQVIHKLEQDSTSIGVVLDVIKGIAEQTNLLALNAAIEAARAGEQGRGFAVVADEVRTLAQRTAQSTQEIRQMIEQLQSGAKNAVKVMAQGKIQAQMSVEQAAKAGVSLESITQVAANISDMNTQIASAAEEQSKVAEEINRNIVNISQVAGQATTGTLQAAEASNELARLAASLQSMVAQFKLS